MTRDQFDALVRRLEDEDRANPRAYRRRVMLLALAGYGYIGLVLLSIVAVIALMIWAALNVSLGRGALSNWVWALAAFGFLIVRSLWVRLPPPQGIPLDAKHAPRLFETIGELQRVLKAPRVHHVVLDVDFNAGITQRPRLGVFGWHRNYLVLGLPLLQVLSPDQFRAVLAHEFGHLSEAHGALGARIYSVREGWLQLLQALERKRHWGSQIFTRFFQWYAPYFDACSFVLRRAQEYEADRAAATQAGSRPTADALVAIHVYGALLAKQFWPRIYKRADDEYLPPTPFRELCAAPFNRVSSATMAASVEQALRMETGTEESHPALGDRLAALGEQARVPEPSAETAAHHFLGAMLPDVTERLDRDWQTRVASDWRERHDQVQADRQRLADLDEQALRGPLDQQLAEERAALTEALRGGEAALPLYRTLVAAHPNTATSQFALGRLLLDQDDEKGIGLIERAAEQDEDAILPGCQLIAAYLERHGKQAEAEPYWRRAAERAELLQAAQHERSNLWFADTYLPHGLTAAQVEQLGQQLARIPEIARAYLVRKDVQHFPERPFYALGMDVKRPGWRGWFGFKVEPQVVFQRVGNEVELPGETLQLLFDDAPSKKMRKIMAAIAGAEIYRR